MTTLLDRFSRTSVCIEFKEDTLILSCFRCDFSGTSLIAASAFPLKQDEETIAELISFIAENVRGPKEVFVSIPYQWTIVKFTEIPSPKAKGKDAVAHMMKFEIERHIPYQIEDVLFDFQVIEKSETMYKVITAAVHKNKITYVKEFLERIACSPAIITITPFAVLNSIEYSAVPTANWQTLFGFSRKSDILGRKGEKCVSLFFDNSAVSMAVLSGGSCINLSSFYLDNSIPVGAAAEDISSRLDGILKELSLEKLSKLLMAGSLPSLSGLAGALNEKIGINVQVVQPASKFLKNKAATEMPQLAAGIGLCYSGSGIGALQINLLPRKADAVFKKTGALVSKISIPLILLMAAGIFAGDVVNDKRMLSRINKKISENEPEVKVIENIQADIRGLKQRKDFLNAAKDGNTILDMLSELANILPSDVWISNFQYKTTVSEKEAIPQTELIMSGFAKSSAVLITLMEDSPFFEKVEFVGPINKRGATEEFKVKMVTVRPKVPEAPAAGPAGEDKAVTAEPKAAEEPAVPPKGEDKGVTGEPKVSETPAVLPNAEDKAVTVRPGASETPAGRPKREGNNSKTGWGIK